MKSKPKKARAYRSVVRKEHSEHTADRILDAAVARVSKGDRTLSFAAIAREARVSVPTVYRHFPTIDDMIRAFAERASQRHRDVRTERGALPGIVRDFFKRFDDPADLAKVSRLNVIWKFSRMASVPLRSSMFDQLFRAEAPRLRAAQRRRYVDICVVIFSTVMGEALRGYLDRTGTEMGDRVTLALDAVIEHAIRASEASEQRTPAPTADPKPPTRIP